MESRRKKIKKIATLTGRRVHGPETYKDGKTHTKKLYEVRTPEGLRWYKGEGTSRISSMAQRQAEWYAGEKANLSPEDSVITGGKIPSYPSVKEKPKKKKEI